MQAKQLSMNMVSAPGAKLKPPDLQVRWLDISDIAVGTGFTTRVAVSLTLSDALEPITTESDGDYDQRLWDALWLAHFQLSLDHHPSATFNFTFPRKHWRTGEISEACLHLRVEVQKDAAYLGLLEDF